jgi:hypothetical protein
MMWKPLSFLLLTRANIYFVSNYSIIYNRNCINEYVKSKIVTGEVMKIACPYDTCSTELNDE